MGHDAELGARTRDIFSPLRGRVPTLTGRVPLTSARGLAQRGTCSDLFRHFLPSLHYLLALPSLWAWGPKYHQT